MGSVSTKQKPTFDVKQTNKYHIYPKMYNQIIIRQKRILANAGFI